VAIVKNGERHRADKVIELQHSALGVNKIRAREAFYTQMIWLFDVRASRPEPRYHPEYYGGRIPTNMEAIRLCLRQKEGYHTFRWYHPKKSVAYATALAYLDVGRGEIFHLKKIGFGTPCAGWGVLKPAEAFVAWLRRSSA